MLIGVCRRISEAKERMDKVIMDEDHLFLEGFGSRR